MANIRNGPNLATGTNTLADTSARVHTVGKCSYNWYAALVADKNKIMNNTAEFGYIQNEIAIGIGRPFNPDFGFRGCDTPGQTPFFTNSMPMNNGPDSVMDWYIKLFDARDPKEAESHSLTPAKVNGQAFYPPDLFFAGICRTDGQPHTAAIGDTVGTLFIGGVYTIMNGRFPMKCGDDVMWYFEEEADADKFDAEGCRRPPDISQEAIDAENANPNRATQLTAYQKKIRDYPYAERAFTKTIVRIKPFIPGLDDTKATICDKNRVFAKATMSAGPYQNVDIKVGRMSL